MTALLTRVRDWLRPSHESDHHLLDAIAGRMLGDYAAAVAGGAPREELADILTGIAGCELAMSRTMAAMGWDPEPAPGEPVLAESARLSGLLVQEVAYAAAEGQGYRGVRCRELDTTPIGEALRGLALAYDVEPVSVGRRLSEVWQAVAGVIGGQAAEALVPLMAAHGQLGLVTGGAR